MKNPLTIEDLRNPARQSGFSHVSYNRPDRPSPNSHGGGKNLYQAQRGSDATKSTFFRGPMRATAEQAAQDACDYFNGATIRPATKLPTHQHPQAPRIERTQAEKDALKVLREAEEKRNKNRVKEAYIKGEEGSIEFLKIGSAYDSEVRSGSLQTGNPRRLITLGTLPGGEVTEQLLQQKFLEHHWRGEWFFANQSILDTIGMTWDEYKAAVGYKMTKVAA